MASTIFILGLFDICTAYAILAIKNMWFNMDNFLIPRSKMVCLLGWMMTGPTATTWTADPGTSRPRSALSGACITYNLRVIEKNKMLRIYRQHLFPVYHTCKYYEPEQYSYQIYFPYNSVNYNGTELGLGLQAAKVFPVYRRRLAVDLFFNPRYDTGLRGGRTRRATTRSLTNLNHKGRR